MSKHEVPMDWEKFSGSGIPAVEGVPVSEFKPPESRIMSDWEKERQKLSSIRNVSEDPVFLRKIAQDQRQMSESEYARYWGGEWAQSKYGHDISQHVWPTQYNSLRDRIHRRWNTIMFHLRRKLREFREYLT